MNSNKTTCTVDYASTANVTGDNNGYTLEESDDTIVLMVDGVAPVVDDLVLLKDQTSDAANGVYKVTRLNSVPMGVGYQLQRVCMGVDRIYTVYVKAGSTQAMTWWCTDLGTDPYTPGVTDQAFTLAVVDTGDTYNKTVITADRTFPIIGTEGVATLGELNAKSMWVTLWGGGGGGAGYSGGGGTGGCGGGSSSAVVSFPIDPNSTNLSSETLGVIIGAGGSKGASSGGAGGDGGDTSVVSTDTDTEVNLTAYGGGGGEEDGQQPGGAGGTGGAASRQTGGIANSFGGAAGASGADGTATQDVQSIIGYWWTGVTGGDGGFVGQRGSHFHGHGRGGVPNQEFSEANAEGSGGGAGGFYGNGGAAGPASGSGDPDSIKDAEPNSGGGGGAASGFGNDEGGAGGAGGVIIEWIS